MSRDDGFAVMDVSTDIANDPKFRRVQRLNPDHVSPAFMAYTAVVAESWKAGQRVPVSDAWPILLPYDPDVVGSMKTARLLDAKGYVPVKAWSGWFKAASERRAKSRERWHRANEKRAAEASGQPELRTNDSAGDASLPRGDSDVTRDVPRRDRSSPSVPSVPSVPSSPSSPLETKEIPPPPAERGRRSNGTNPRANGTAPRAKATSPRSKGTSTRQVRADQKRGPSNLGEAMRRAMAAQDAQLPERDEPDDDDLRFDR